MMVKNSIYKIAHDNNVLISLMIELNTTCNENCLHCYIPKHDNHGMNTETIFKIIKQFRDMGGLNLSLTGGEIFLRKDILSIIEYAKQLNLRVYLLTNATLITEEIAKKLSKLYVSELSVSVYSLEEKIHDSITKTPGSLKNTLRGLDFAKKYNVPIFVKTPIMYLNKNSYNLVREYCKRNGFKFMASPIIFCKSDGDFSVKSLEVEDSDLINIISNLSEFESDNHFELYDEACGALKYSLAIDSKGDVYPCNSLYIKVGNVLSENLMNIWSSDKLHKIQNILKTDLSECPFCELKANCKRCPGLALLEDKNLFGCSSSAKKMAGLCMVERRGRSSGKHIC